MLFEAIGECSSALVLCVEGGCGDLVCVMLGWRRVRSRLRNTIEQLQCGYECVGGIGYLACARPRGRSVGGGGGGGRERTSAGRRPSSREIMKR